MVKNKVKKNQKKTIKAFYTTGNSDLTWNTNFNTIPVNNIEEADIVVFTGGADVGAEYYNQKRGRYSSGGGDRDEREIKIFKKALELKKPMYGICRGHQLICVGLGGTLIQHVSHGGGHMVKTYDGEEFYTNSIHHQMIRPLGIEHDFKILSWTENISKIHLDENDVEIEFEENECKEIEAIVYPELKIISIQSHPEWERNDVANKWLEKQFQAFNIL